MGIEQAVIDRSGNVCELCASAEGLSAFEVVPSDNSSDQYICACQTCQNDMAESTLTANYWHCLHDSMWSQVPAVQVVAYRLLTRLAGQHEVWAQDQLEALYLEEDTLAWAQSSFAHTMEDDISVDCNGVVLQGGDTVVLVKDLQVKGAGFTAKQGTVVKKISLTNNPDHIEGKINGQRIVIIAAYTRKQ